MSRFQRWAGWGVGVCAGLALATCFKAPSFDGPYRCLEDGGCGSTGMTCDDGICCRPGGEPWCPTYVADGGTCEDGGAPREYYLDEDGDGYGRDDTWRWYCISPYEASWVPRGGDCNDALGVGQSINPGEPEQCDGIDTNCNGLLDEGLAPQQEFFFDPDDDGYGDADAGVWACKAPPGYVPNGLDCAPADPRVGVSSYDKCDGLDNNCNGSTDERPDCGGPNLFTAGVNVGAKRLFNWYSGRPPSCLKDGFGGPAPNDTVSAGLVWSGTGPESHVFWVEAADAGTYWDLSQPGQVLKLRFSESVTGGAYAQKWDDTTQQPVILLCGPTGHIRYWHSNVSTDPQATPAYILPTNGAAVADAYTYVYLDGGNGWEIGPETAGNVSAVLKQVNRIEVVVEPYGSPTFTIDFNEASFGFQ